MNTSIRNLFTAFALITTSLHFGHSVNAQDQAATVIFVNEHPRDTIELYWVNPDVYQGSPERLRFESAISPRGGSHRSNSFVGHEFYYRYNGEDNYIRVDEPNKFGESLILLTGGKDVRVRCKISVNSGTAKDSFDILVKTWAPRGASHFLDLVRHGHYNGVAFNRVVPNFLIQFGIAADYDTRSDAREVTIWDDRKVDIAFEPGYVSYAGSGHDSRSSEMFIAMPGASKEQLGNFGKNSWETPIGYVEGDLSVLGKIYSGYGDMAPWGNGPDSKLIYAEDGYTKYLPKNFPKLDSINTCYIVEEKGFYTEDEL